MCNTAMLFCSKTKFPVSRNILTGQRPVPLSYLSAASGGRGSQRRIPVQPVHFLSSPHSSNSPNTMSTPDSTDSKACCGNAGDSCESISDCCETAADVCASSCYYKSSDLGRFGEIGRSNPAVAGAFFDYYGKVMEDNRLTKREKSLIGLAVAHALKCPYCIDSLSGSCLDQGISEAEMMEAVHVAGALAAGVTLVHSTQMLGHIDARAGKS